LVGNAIKFTKLGEIVIRVDVEGELAETAHLHFSVRDTGIGIPAEKQRVIFEAFTQADASMTRNFGGTGLGLAITSQLVALMGGRLWVESEVDKGSTFHFSVRLEKQSVPASKFQSGPLNLEGMPVLVVDDNAANRTMLAEILTNWRMRPSTVSDGLSAVAAMKRAIATGDPFPLVLIDAGMPEVDGFAFVEHIKRNPELVTATIMMLSSADRNGDVLRCREIGVACYLRKPITKPELFDAILKAMGAGTLAEPEPLRSGKTESQEALYPLRILLAEDNEINQELAVKTLEKLGHTVLVVGNGQQAFELIKKEAVDLILMDMQMPVMDGFAATKAIP
jgi:CheY-like chemotaxis protein